MNFVGIGFGMVCKGINVIVVGLGVVFEVILVFLESDCFFVLWMSVKWF